MYLQYDTAAAQKMSSSLPSVSEVAGDLDAMVLEATPGHKHSRKTAQHTSPAPPRFVYMTTSKQRLLGNPCCLLGQTATAVCIRNQIRDSSVLVMPCPEM